MNQITTNIDLQWYDVEIPAGTIATHVDEYQVLLKYPDGSYKLMHSLNYNRTHNEYAFVNNVCYGYVSHICYANEIMNYIKKENWYFKNKKDYVPVLIELKQTNDLRLSSND